MKTAELRKLYLGFFKEKNHKLFPSDTLVPDDPSVLFTSAGMNQFKPYFLGEKKDCTRATSCQKCLRTGDIDEVGKTAFHHTFFEMLGNFSFGDYFKKEAIEFAYELLTKRLNLKEDVLSFSVYKDDAEAYDIWKDHIGVSTKKIIKLDQKNNFWPANAPSLGPNGPCGPCSEIFFDKGSHIGCKSADCSPACSCGRFVEIWNLVFTQFNRVGENILEPLPQKNIDTGMGLERMASVLQGKDSNFEIDILEPIVRFVREVLNVSATDPETKSLLHAVVDHIRAATFAIADGVQPSNEKRGFVIRKLIRIALWKMDMLSKGKKTHQLVSFPEHYAQYMGDTYPEIREKKDAIAKILEDEEYRFQSTLTDGEKLIVVIVNGLKKQGKNIIESQDAFRLYDTYGVPLELSKGIAQQNGMTVDEAGFNALLEKQKELSRKKSMFDANIFKEKEFNLTEKTQFVGYQTLESNSTVMRIFSGVEERESLSQDLEGFLVCDKTPLYAESGGQLGDRGIIRQASGEFMVEEVIKIADAIVHKGKVVEGVIMKGAAQVMVEKERRCALARSHTATHLLQTALRSVLGTHVAQQGSLVDEDRLRFDFTQAHALSDEALRDVENLVNDYIAKASQVSKIETTPEEAKKLGALAFFKDKYGERVRLVQVGDYSKELCAGTHLDNTAEIGCFLIVSESSISSGIRRIEAVVGRRAYERVRMLSDMIAKCSTSLRCAPTALGDAVKKIQEELTLERKKVVQVEKELIRYQSIAILDQVESINGVNFVSHTFSDKDIDVLLYLCDTIRKEHTSMFIFFVSVHTNKKMFICSVTDDLASRGLGANKFVNRYKDKLALKGGGRDSLVQGVLVNQDAQILEHVQEYVHEFLKS